MSARSDAYERSVLRSSSRACSRFDVRFGVVGGSAGTGGTSVGESTRSRRVYDSINVANEALLLVTLAADAPRNGDRVGTAGGSMPKSLAGDVGAVERINESVLYMERDLATEKRDVAVDMRVAAVDVEAAGNLDGGEAGPGRGDGGTTTLRSDGGLCIAMRRSRVFDLSALSVPAGADACFTAILRSWSAVPLGAGRSSEGR